MDATRIYSVGDARRRAARSVPRALFDYIDGGAEDEVTLDENIRAFREVAFRPRMAGTKGLPVTSTSLLGTALSMPVILAPCGLVRFMHLDGASGVARAAAAMGTVSVLSTVAGSSLEEVAASASGPKWFQLYAPGGPEQSALLVERAQRAGYAGLVVTLDTPALGNREPRRPPRGDPALPVLGDEREPAGGTGRPPPPMARRDGSGPDRCTNPLPRRHRVLGA